MVKHIFAKTKSQKGFTLTEIVIAMAIVTVLSVVGFQNFTKDVREAKIVEAQAEAATLEIAIQTYNRNNPTAKISSTSDEDIQKLATSGLLQHGPKFKASGDDTCVYAFEQYNNGQFTTTESHVVLKGCTFASDKIITSEGVFSS